jgi:hypothetical protein
MPDSKGQAFGELAEDGASLHRLMGRQSVHLDDVGSILQCIR